ncbi:hypothetical protein ACS0TY_000592 [Phlomoides rotata]
MERQNSSGSIKIHIAEPNLVIPEEIVEELLSRLPVQSLLKFRCVSKSWRSLIDSECFIKFHLKKSTEDPCFSHHRIILNPIRSRERQLMMCSWRSLLKEPIANKLEFDDVKYVDREVNLVGSCNGLVCLLQDRKNFVLWNPSTRMSFDLPDARQMSTLDMGSWIFPMYGFGYDESSDDYKVFAIVTSKCYLRCPPVCKLYSLNTHSWKTLGDCYSPFSSDRMGKFVNGKLHWFGIIGEELGLVSLDLKNEVYEMIEQPSSSFIIEQPSSSFAITVPTPALGVIEGCLSVLWDYPNSHFDVWVMKEYGVKDSWVKMFTLPNLHHPSLRRQAPRSFCRGPNGELLLIYYNSTMMIYSYNAEDDVFHFSHIINIGEVCEVMEADDYVQSLVSLRPDAEEEEEEEEDGSDAEDERQTRTSTLEDQNDISE